MNRPRFAALVLPLVFLAPAAGQEAKTKPRAENAKAISPAVARKKVDETVTVRMEVKSSRLMSDREVAYLNSEKDYRSAENFTIFIGKDALAKFKEAKIDDPAKHYDGKTIEVTGKVTLYRERPQIPVARPDDIKVVKSEPKPETNQAADPK
jgi:DNA/RNA endonuclease YhcR with UshA esterase domain